MDKSAIRKFAVQARIALIEQVSQQAYNCGINENGDCNKSNTQIKKLSEQIKKYGYKQVIENIAYIWFNRFIALRFMEVNDYLPSHIRIFSNYKGEFKPEILDNVLTLKIKGLDKNKVSELLDYSDGTEDLYRYLILTQCNELNETLPEMFEKIGGYTELLFPLKILSDDSIIAHLVNDIPEKDFNVSTNGQVEILGWLYQYYISEHRYNVIKTIGGKTIKKEDIPAATQLFTTDWVVRYLVDNSLGRYWIERNPNSELKSKLKYFVGNVQFIDEKIYPEDVTFFDPCMGSGHILVYAFEVLMEIYKEHGYSEREASYLIVKKNLFGLDIDDRAYQLAYFAVMMKGRSYDRRFLTKLIEPNIYAIQESNEGIFKYGKELGSLISINKSDLEKIKNGSECYIKQARILSQKYDIVCTNPPYMNRFEGHLRKFLSDKYKLYKGDLFSVFLYRNFDFCKKDGYSAFMTPNVWLFIKTYENIRNYLIKNKSITTLIQMAKAAFFKEATVDVCAFVLKNSKDDAKGIYIRLEDFKGDMEVQKQKVLEALQNKNCKYVYAASTKNFLKIPGSPIAYWVSENFISIFNKGTPLSDIAEIVTGITTGNNDLYLKIWREVDFSKISIYSNDINNIDFSNKKWIPYNKGGEARKWFGNNDYIVKWSESSKFHRPKPNLKHLYLKEGLTWSFVTSGMFSARYYPSGFLWDVSGSPCIIEDKSLLMYTLAYLSTKIANIILKIINPTINCQVYDIQRMPIIVDSNSIPKVGYLAKNNIEISKSDWDSFETSWDFKKHPLLNGNNIQFAYENWENECNIRFNTLKNNEEELNRIFISIYGLQKELTPEIDDRNITVRKAEYSRDIKSFISYAVGCMFGRYSLDAEGLIYAGGNWDSNKYTSIIPTIDNIITICHEECFTDDIANRFIKFVSMAYGSENLERNINFIAKVLGNKGVTSRDVIRNYFLNDFYKDHVKVYQKRPIYWLFDSGKKNGFKALIYMHRYKPDLLARMRTDYIHKQQEYYRNQLLKLEEDMISASDSYKIKLSKKYKKLQEQSFEIYQYEEKIHHLADQNIIIDLDDGVYKNYDIFSDVMPKIK